MNKSFNTDVVSAAVGAFLNRPIVIDIIRNNVQQATVQSVEEIVNHPEYLELLQSEVSKHTTKSFEEFYGAPADTKSKSSFSPKGRLSIGAKVTKNNTSYDVPTKSSLEVLAQTCLSFSDEVEVPKELVTVAPKRGRKPKAPEKLNTTVTLVKEPEVKKPRGRPSKLPLKAAVVIEEKIEAPVGRGRKRKLSTSIVQNRSVLDVSNLENPTPAMAALLKKREEAAEKSLVKGATAKKRKFK